MCYAIFVSGICTHILCGELVHLAWQFWQLLDFLFFRNDNKTILRVTYAGYDAGEEREIYFLQKEGEAKRDRK